MIRFMLRPDVAVRVPACFAGCRFAAGAYGGGQQKRAWQQFSQMGKLPYVFPDMSIF